MPALTHPIMPSVIKKHGGSMKKHCIGFLFIALLASFSACFSEDDKGDDYKLTCKIDGVSRTFYAGKFGLDTYDNTYSNFYESKDNDEEYFFLQFPHPVAVGTPYTRSVAKFEFSYNPPSSVDFSSALPSSTISVMVTEWGTNNGDPISGTFSGTLYNVSSGFVTITDGTFESKLVVN
jgi:hypothetical protein